MADPITMEDLYGKSEPVSGDVHPATGLPIEETPEIHTEAVVAPAPDVEPAQSAIPSPTPSYPPSAAPKHKPSVFNVFGVILVFLGLFGVGIWLSTIARQYFPDGFSVGTLLITPTPVPVNNAPLDPTANWTVYQVTSGSTKKPIEGITFKLPPEVLAPVCDNVACGSQGTYLPGGTRFTVAPRGVGQLLSDFRGAEVTDVNGISFLLKEATVSGHAARDFSGMFNGKTVTGYTFTQMHGLMIAITPQLSLELNHFTPTGVTADFARDDVLFDQIVGTLNFSAAAPATSSGN